MTRPVENVLISGAGIAGPTLAYWLLRAGIQPTLVERASRPRTGGYMIDFWGVGYDVAERMGLVDVLRHDGYAIDEVRIMNREGKIAAQFNADVFRTATHSRFFSMLRGDLAHRLFETVADRAETIFGDEITRLDDHGSTVTASFAHSPPRAFDLVVGADGLHSQVRALAFPNEGAQRYLGYHTAAFSGAHYPHRDEGTYVSYALPGAQVARYALRGDRSAFFFVFAGPEADAPPPHDVAAQTAMIRARFSGAGWECDEILAALDDADDLYFDVVAQMRLPRWSHGRVALIGDAAYAPSLLAGQGAAFAMAGAYVLAAAIAADPADPIAACTRYQEQFKPFIDEKQRAAERFGSWFAPSTAFGIHLRNFVTNLFRVPFVGDFIANRTLLGDRFTLPDWPAE